MLFRSLFLSVIPLGFLLCTGCGQNPETKESRSPTGSRRNTDSAQIWSFIQRQKLACPDKFLCQESVAKLIVIDSQTIRYCTAALVDSNVLVTSASCLTRSLKIPNLDCSENIFAVFPQTNIQTQQVFRCDRVLEADVNEEVDKALWRSDLAFIKLKEAPSRRVLDISREGMSDQAKYTVWKSSYLSDTDSTLSASNCKPVFNSYMNPFAASAKSPMVAMVDCPFVEGNTGGVVLNDNEEVVGILSSDLDQKIKEFVLTTGWLNGELKPLAHASNLACARLPFSRQTDVEDDSCYKKIDQALLDKQRATLMKSKNLHAYNIAKITEQMEKKPMKYFNWLFTFVPSSTGEFFELHMKEPKCFFDIQKWISEFRSWGRVRTYGLRKIIFPNYRLKSGLGGDLKAISLVENLGEKEYTIEFNPRSAWSWKKTYVKISAPLFGTEHENRFEDISPICN